ncbi:response regulator [Chroococcus sp. FPU101]|uniref:response regulator n=1 Tax=Chroococcus sp. FPU101 TaxID=1974212 RepID=UPI001A8D7593|nr:response regulator [Chroococcus sp. FPU101]
MRILLIEDDVVLADILVQSLKRLRYLVDAVEDGELGWEYTQSASYDLILMDVGLPKLDGISLCERLRRQGYSTPILLMTAKDEQRDRIRGLDAGADDYLIKPVNIEELQARLRALLRRGEVSPSTIIEFSQLRLDPKSCEVTFNQKLLSLTPKEYSLLELFMRNPSRVFSRGQLIEQLWSFEDTPQEDSVKAHIKGLRQKLKTAGARDWIENVYGLGYRFNPKVEQQTSIEQEFRENQEKLWKQYLGLTQQRLDILHHTASSLVKGQLTLDEQTAARQAAHKLAGVLGMFEREYGSVLAKQIEKNLESSDISLQTQKVCELIQELSDYLNLATEPSLEPELETVSNYFLLVDTDGSVGNAGESFSHVVGGRWKVTTQRDAQTWLQNNTCDGVILNLEQNQTDLKLLSELAQRTPPIPVLVLISHQSIIDRVTIAQAGGRAILTKPVTLEKIGQVFSQLVQRYRSQNTRVLVVDDDPILLASLRPLLEPWGIQMTGLSNPLKCWEILETVKPDLLILDVEMPQLNGIELCQVIRTDSNWQDLPILFLTAHQEIDTIQDIFRVGGDDYILKPVVAQEFLTRITQRLERNRLLKTLSYRDAVTGLMNQLRSHQEFKLMLEQAKEHQQPLTFVLLKLSQLPQINREYGHEVGHQILLTWSNLIQMTFSRLEDVGYWNDGEFAITIPNFSKTEAQQTIEDLLTRIRKQIFSLSNQQKLQPLCDWAIVEYPTEGTTIQSLYQAAMVIIDQKNR